MCDSLRLIFKKNNKIKYECLLCGTKFNYQNGITDIKFNKQILLEKVEL